MDAFTAHNIAKNEYRVFYEAIECAARDGKFECRVAVLDTENTKKYYEHLFNFGYTIVIDTALQNPPNIFNISWLAPHSKSIHDDFVIDVNLDLKYDKQRYTSK